MWQLFESESLFDTLTFVQDYYDTPIVGFEELPKCQYGENLCLSEIVSAAKVGISRYGLLGCS